MDRLIREAAPRAPAGFADGVERRLRAEGRTRARLIAFGAFVAAAAGLIVWLLARAPSPRVVESAWTVAAARAATVTRDGARAELTAGRRLPVGALVTVARGGEALLERATALGTARARLGDECEARVEDGALELLAGSVRLEGPEARLTGDVAAVETLGVSADVAVELRRNPMWKMIPKAAALSALLAVTVQDGGARVEAKGHEPIVLAKNDRTLVAPRLPPLTTRGSAANPGAAKKTPPTVTAKKSAPPADPGTATATGGIDKDSIRRVVRNNLGDIKACYEAALADNPKLSGRIVVEMTVVTKDGKGRVSEGEIVPSESGDLSSAKVQQCVLEALSRAEFPPSVDGQPVVIHYPFLFADSDDAQ